MAQASAENVRGRRYCGSPTRDSGGENARKARSHWQKFFWYFHFRGVSLPALRKEFNTRSGEEAVRTRHSRPHRQSREEAVKDGRKAAPCTGAALLENMELSPVFYHEGGRQAMTKQDLSYHLQLKKQLAADLELLASLEAAAGPRVQHLDGMPHASGVRDVVGDLAAEIADLKTEISEFETEISRSEVAIMDYISTIKDARTRTIFRLRFIRGMAWKEVAATIGWISESGVKAIYDRYIARGGPARMGRPPKKRD